MASKDDLVKTENKGVYYREHQTNKHGVRKDRQWVIIQRLGGKLRTSTLGWTSMGVKESYAISKAHEYRENNKWNRENPDQFPKPICKDDEDAIAAELAAKLEEQRAIEAQENMTIAELWEEVYLPVLQQSKKARTVESEEALYRKWIKTPLGKKKDYRPVALGFQPTVKGNNQGGKIAAHGSLCCPASSCKCECGI